MKSITLEVSHPSAEPGAVEGFRYLWARYVKGFDPRVHCQKCLVGVTAPNFSTPTARSGRPVVFDRMDRYEYLYVCGVGSGAKAELGRRNLHFPLRHAPGETATIATYNGYVFTARDAAVVPIPALPDGWGGRDAETTRCRNFRFGVASYGGMGGGGA